MLLLGEKDFATGGHARFDASSLLIIWLLQQTPTGSVERCPDRRFPGRFASFRPTLLPRRPARDIWQPVVGRMDSVVPDADMKEPMSW